MHVLRRVSLVSVILTALLLAPGCSDDDDPTTPEGFQVTIVVTDDAGNPLEGLDLSMVPELPYYQDGKRIPTSVSAPDVSRMSAFPNPFYPDEAPTTIAYVLEDNASVHMRIYTLSGGLVLDKQFSTGDLGGMAGLNEVPWNGRNNQGDPVASGGYIVFIEAEGNGTTMHVMRRKIGVIW